MSRTLTMISKIDDTEYELVRRTSMHWRLTDADGQVFSGPTPEAAYALAEEHRG